MSCLTLTFTNLCSCYCAFQFGKNYQKNKTSNRINNSRELFNIDLQNTNHIPLANIVELSEINSSNQSDNLVEAQPIRNS